MIRAFGAHWGDSIQRDQLHIVALAQGGAAAVGLVVVAPAGAFFLAPCSFDSFLPHTFGFSSPARGCGCGVGYPVSYPPCSWHTCGRQRELRCRSWPDFVLSRFVLPWFGCFVSCSPFLFCVLFVWLLSACVLMGIHIRVYTRMPWCQTLSGRFSHSIEHLQQFGVCRSHQSHGRLWLKTPSPEIRFVVVHPIASARCVPALWTVLLATRHGDGLKHARRRAMAAFGASHREPHRTGSRAPTTNFNRLPDWNTRPGRLNDSLQAYLNGRGPEQVPRATAPRDQSASWQEQSPCEGLTKKTSFKQWRR